MTIKAGTIMTVAVFSAVSASMVTLAWVMNSNVYIGTHNNNTGNSIIQKSLDKGEPPDAWRNMIYAAISPSEGRVADRVYSRMQL